jgi:hypothetical protein
MESEKIEIINFIQSKTNRIVDEKSILPRDLGIIGIDAECFFEEFFTFFKINGDDFNLNIYNLNDVADIGIFQRLINLFKLKSKKTFSLNHLVEVKKEKRWFDSPSVRRITK